MLGNCSKSGGCLQLAFSPHHGFITLPLYSLCSFNHFSSCCTSFCNIRGKGVCMGKGICGHNLIPTPLLCDRIKENTRKHRWKGMNTRHGTSNHTSGHPSV